MPTPIANGELGSVSRPKINAALGAVTDESDILLTSRTAAVTAPSTGFAKAFARSIGGRIMAAILGPQGFDTIVQPHIGRGSVCLTVANGGASTGLSSIRMGPITVAGTLTATTAGNGSLHALMKRVEALITTAAATAIASFRTSSNLWFLGSSSAKLGGFHFVYRWGPATGVATATMRAFVGMSGTAAGTAPTDVEPSSLLNQVGMGWDAADAQIQIMHNDGTGVSTKIALGASFPVPTTDRAKVYELALYSPPGSTQRVDYQVTDLDTDAVASGTITADLPAASLALGFRSYMSAGGTSSVVGMAFMGLYIESDY